MEITKWKLFLNYEKEEKWINEMASSGKMFTKFNHYEYTFKRDISGKYIYRIQFLDKKKNEDSYLDLLKESNIELVDRVGNWLYLRKEVKDDKFQIYSDIDSKIANYKKILKFTSSFAYGLFTLLLIGVFMAIKFSNTNSFFSGFGLGMSIVLLPFTLFMEGTVFRYKKHMNKLIEENSLYE